MHTARLYTGVAACLAAAALDNNIQAAGRDGRAVGSSSAISTWNSAASSVVNGGAPGPARASDQTFALEGELQANGT